MSSFECEVNVLTMNPTSSSEPQTHGAGAEAFILHRFDNRSSRGCIFIRSLNLRHWPSAIMRLLGEAQELMILQTTSYFTLDTRVPRQVLKS